MLLQEFTINNCREINQFLHYRYDMTYHKNSCINPGGAVICFVVYVILCGQIITLLESQWLIIPNGLKNSVNKINIDGENVEVLTSYDSNNILHDIKVISKFTFARL